MKLRSASLVLFDKTAKEKYPSWFSDWGWNIFLCDSSEICLKGIAEHNPSLLLIDANEHFDPAIELLKSLKLNRQANPIPVVFVSTEPNLKRIIKGTLVNPECLLCKPVDELSLRKTIENALNIVQCRKQQKILWELSFHLLSDSAFLDDHVEQVSRAWFVECLDAKQKRHLILAIREMAMNAIEWGHCKRKEEIVDLYYRIYENRLEIVIRDCGPGFNPKCLPHAADRKDPLQHMNIREAKGIREGGFGILMTKGLVDDLAYNDTGNEVRLIKYLPSEMI